MLPSTVFAQITSINWQSNFDFAKKLAQSKNQPMIVYFMETPAGVLSSSVLTTVFTNVLIVDRINTYFVAVLVEGTPVLEREYNIQGKYPTLLVLDKNNVEIDRISGYITVDAAYSMLENAQKNHANFVFNSAKDNGNNVESAALENAVFSYDNGSGSFIKMGKKWIHKTLYYTVNYTETKEDGTHYYLVSEDKKTYVTVPLVAGGRVFVWQEEKRWVSAGSIVTVEEPAKTP